MAQVSDDMVQVSDEMVQVPEEMVISKPIDNHWLQFRKNVCSK